MDRQMVNIVHRGDALLQDKSFMYALSLPRSANADYKEKDKKGLAMLATNFTTAYTAGAFARFCRMVPE
jgi:hypothetical protein